MIKYVVIVPTTYTKIKFNIYEDQYCLFAAFTALTDINKDSSNKNNL